MPCFLSAPIAKPEQDGEKRQASGRKLENSTLYTLINNMKKCLIRELAINKIERFLNSQERNARFFRAKN